MPRLLRAALVATSLIAAAPLADAAPTTPTTPTTTTTTAAKSTSSPTPATPPTPDDLWKLAPAGVTQGIVLDGPTIEAGLITAGLIRTALASSPHPELATILNAAVTVDGVDLLSAESILAAGADPRRGVAVFYVGTEAVFALAVTDEKRFRAVSRQSHCRRIGELTACGPRAALLGALGKDTRLATAARARPPHMRGGLEAVFDKDGQPMNVTVTMTRGRAELHLSGRVAGLPSVPTLDANPLRSHVETSPATGVLSVDLRGIIAAAAAAVTDPAAASIFQVLRGDAIAVALRGAPLRGWIRIGLQDVDAARALLARCHQLPWPAPLQAKARKGGCELSGIAPAGVPLRLHLRIDGDTLLGETHKGAAAERGTPEPQIATLLARPALFAMWGRGLGSTPVLPDGLPRDIQVALPWWLAHLDELGATVGMQDGTIELHVLLGTAWQNPDAVLRPLEELILRFALGESTHKRIVRLAKKHPRSLLAGDVAAGAGGLVLPLGLVATGFEAALPFLAPPAISN